MQNFPMAVCAQMNIKRDTFYFTASATSLKQQLYSFGSEHTIIIQNDMAEGM